MDPIRVLHLAPPGFGGIDAYIFSHYKHMDQNEFQFDFLTQNHGLAGAEQYKDFRYHVHPLSVTASTGRSEFIQYVTDVLRGNYDIFHIHTSYWTGFLLEELARKAGVRKIIVHAHSAFIDEQDDAKRAQLLCHHKEIKQAFSTELATDFWACSQFAADWLFGPQIPKEKIRILKNAIELERYRFNAEKRSHIRNKLGIENALVLGTAGRLSYQKNQMFLVELFKKFHQEHPRSKLIILGDGELRDDLNEQIHRSGLEQAVLMLGWKTDIEVYFQAMDIFLLPSRFEGLGIAALEAAASGLPCIVSDQVPSDVAVSETVRRVPLSISDWGRALEEMIQVRIDRQQGAEIVRAVGYDVQQQAKVLESLYRA